MRRPNKIRRPNQQTQKRSRNEHWKLEHWNKRNRNQPRGGESIHDSINAITMAQSTRHSSRCWNRTRAVVKRALTLSTRTKTKTIGSTNQRHPLRKDPHNPTRALLWLSLPSLPERLPNPFSLDFPVLSPSPPPWVLSVPQRLREYPSPGPSYASPKGTSQIVFGCCSCAGGTEYCRHSTVLCSYHP